MNFRARACLISTVWAMTKNVNKPFFHLHINAIVILLLWCLKKQRIAYGCDHKQNLSQSSWKPITFMWNGIFWCFQQRCPEFESPPTYNVSKQKQNNENAPLLSLEKIIFKKVTNSYSWLMLHIFISSLILYDCSTIVATHFSHIRLLYHCMFYPHRQGSSIFFMPFD